MWTLYLDTCWFEYSPICIFSIDGGLFIFHACRFDISSLLVSVADPGISEPEGVVKAQPNSWILRIVSLPLNTYWTHCMLTTIKIYAVKIYKNKPKIYFKLVCAPGVPVLDPPLSLNIIILYFTHVCIVRLYNIHCGKYIGVHKFP